jgi:hypothetical protein
LRYSGGENETVKFELGKTMNRTQLTIEVLEDRLALSTVLPTSPVFVNPQPLPPAAWLAVAPSSGLDSHGSLGHINYDDVTLSRGIVPNADFQQWASNVKNSSMPNAQYPPIALERGLTQDSGFSQWLDGTQQTHGAASSSVGPLGHEVIDTAFTAAPGTRVDPSWLGIIAILVG